MIDYTHVILSVAISLLIAVGLSLYSYKRLSANKFFSLSLTTLHVFIISRAAYYFVFTLMICAFFLAIIVFGVSGEQARLLIATAPKELNASTLILAEWGNWMLPVLFVTMFIAIFSLGQLGRLVLRSIPEEGAPGKEYGLFRFTFFLLALSLIVPPLVFASLLLL
ncbi:MAG TPA: hypothetical protein VIX80_10800 [Candidatus Kapabacteria bacterium]